MSPGEFIAKWQANTRNERAACQCTGETWADVWWRSRFAWE